MPSIANWRSLRELRTVRITRSMRWISCRKKMIIGFSVPIWRSFSRTYLKSDAPAAQRNSSRPRAEQSSVGVSKACPWWCCKRFYLLFLRPRHWHWLPSAEYWRFSPASILPDSSRRWCQHSGGDRRSAVDQSVEVDRCNPDIRRDVSLSVWNKHRRTWNPRRIIDPRTISTTQCKRIWISGMNAFLPWRRWSSNDDHDRQ